MIRNAKKLIIAGLPRSGSTSLYRYLSSHPAICASSIKETQFFLGPLMNKEVLPKNEYYKYYQHYRNEKYILEASPTYFFGGLKVAEKINEYFDNVKIILVFRDPTERLFSYFIHEKMTGNLKKSISFPEYLSLPGINKNEILRHGNYYQLMKEWHSVFQGNIYLIYLENLKSYPQNEMIELCKWLEIDPRNYLNHNFTVENKGYIYKSYFLNKFSRKIFYTFEPFLRAHPEIKSKLKKIYSYINLIKGKELEMDTESRKYVDEIYSDVNLKLYQFFKNNNYPISSWLTNYENLKKNEKQ